MDVFHLRDQLVHDYANYIGSFINIRDPHIKHHVDDELQNGLLWPPPLIQLNPNFETGAGSMTWQMARYLTRAAKISFGLNRRKVLRGVCASISINLRPFVRPRVATAICLPQALVRARVYLTSCRLLTLYCARVVAKEFGRLLFTQ